MADMDVSEEEAADLPEASRILQYSNDIELELDSLSEELLNRPVVVVEEDGTEENISDDGAGTENDTVSRLKLP
jgi:hypothetical protein